VAGKELVVAKLRCEAGLSTRRACWTKPLRGRFKPTIDHASIFAKDFLIDDVWTIARVRECKLPLTLGVPQ
jgi:hypothetical protein